MEWRLRYSQKLPSHSYFQIGREDTGKQPVSWVIPFLKLRGNSSKHDERETKRAGEKEVESKLYKYLTETIFILAVLLGLSLLWLFARRINPANTKEFKEITVLEKSLKNQPK